MTKLWSDKLPGVYVFHNEETVRRQSKIGIKGGRIEK